MAFQRSAFQSNAFQINDTEDNGWLGGYIPAHQAYTEEKQREKIAQARAELSRVNEELAEAERNKELAQRKARKKAALAALQARLEAEISRLRIERIGLMRRIDEEEAILIMMVISRKRLRAALH